MGDKIEILLKFLQNVSRSFPVSTQEKSNFDITVKKEEMKLYKIERGIPVESENRRALYPFKSMEVGDSFWVPLKAAGEKGLKYLVNSISGCSLRHKPRRFVVKKYEDGVRCWRVE